MPPTEKSTAQPKADRYSPPTAFDSQEMADSFYTDDSEADDVVELYGIPDEDLEDEGGDSGDKGASPPDETKQDAAARVAEEKAKKIEEGEYDSPSDDDKPLEEGDEVVDDKPDFREFASYGLTPAQAEGLYDAGHLESYLAEVDSRLAEAGRRTGPAPQPGPQQQPPQQFAPPRQPPQAPMGPPAGYPQYGQAVPPGYAQPPMPGQPAQQPGQYQIGLDPNEYDETFVNNLQGMADHFTGRVSNLEAMLGQMLQQMEIERQGFIRQRQQEFFEQFDQWVGGLGEDYHDVFGDGPATGLPPASPQIAKRRELLDTMQAMAIGAQQQGHQLSDDDLRRRALRVVASDKIKSQATKEVEQSVRKVQSTALGRSAARGARNVGSRQRAAEYAEKFYKERGH